MDQFDRDSTIADFKNGVTNLMVRIMTSNTVNSGLRKNGRNG